MIAIIESTYANMSGVKEKYSYRIKAEINLESFEILQYLPWFGTLDEFRAVIFSVFTEENQDAVIVHGREDEIGFLLANVEK